MKVTRHLHRLARQADRFSLRTLFIFLVLLLIPLVLLLRIRQHPDPAAAGWWNNSWAYRRSVFINNTSGSTLTNYQAKFTIDTTSNFQTACQDLRVVDSNGHVLNYWIDTNDTGCNNSATKVWVLIPTLPTTGALIYAYYGNPSTADDQSTPASIFTFYDNFDTYSNGTTVPTNTNWSANRTGNWNVNTTNYASSPNSVLAAGTSGSDAMYWLDTAVTSPTTGVIEGMIRASANLSGASDTTRTGICFDTTATPSNGICLLMGGTTNSLQLLYSGIAWGSSYGYSFTAGTWYNFSLVFNTTAIYGKVWPKGSAEPSSFNVSWAYSTRNGAPNYYALTTRNINNAWDDIRVRTYMDANDVIIASGSQEQSQAPIGYWKFDEGFGTAVNNSGNGGIGLSGVFGTGNSAPTWASEDQCLSGKCLKFTGGNAYINLGNQAALKVASKTISYWVKPTSLSSTPIIFSASSGNYYTRILGNGQLFDSWVNSGGTQTTYNPSPTSVQLNNTWQQVTYTYSVSGSNVTVGYYYNGLSVGSTTFSTGYSSSYGSTFVIGCLFTSGTYCYSGLLDEVKAYNYARTPAQIQADYNTYAAASGKGNSAILSDNQANNSLSNGLDIYWKFDEGTGTSTADTTGNGYLGNFVNVGTTAWVAGHTGWGLSLNAVGDTDYVESSSSPTEADATFSIMGWVKPTQTYSGMPAQWYHMFDRPKSGGGYNFEFGYEGWDQGVAFKVNNDGNYVKDVTTLTSGTWYFYAATFSGTTLKLYRNGVLIDSRSDYTSGTPANGQQLFVGGWNGVNFNGVFDEVRLYTRVLSGNEISQVYNYGPSPAAYWNFNEGTGTTAYDISGNNLSAVFATGSSSPSWTSGNFSKGLSFASSGVPSYLTVTDSPSLLGSPMMTTSAWVYPTSFVSSAAIYNRRTSGNVGGVTMELSGTSGAVNCYFYINGGWKNVTTTLLLKLNQWNYVSCTYDGATIKPYINGVGESGTATAGSINNPTSPNVVIGANIANMTVGWNGKIDDVKVYNYARSAAQITQDMNASHPAGDSGSMIAYWKFDEGAGTTAYDSTNNHNNLSFAIGNSAPTWTPNGQVNRALSFNGSTTNLAMPSNSTLNPTTAMSLSAWVKVNAFSNTTYEEIVAKHTTHDVGGCGLQYGLTTGWSDQTAQFFIDTGAPLCQHLGTGSTLLPNQWYYLTATYDSTVSTNNAKIYINGRLDNQTTYSGAIDTDTQTLYVGGGSWFLNGLIDEVKIYNYALTPTDILIDYNQGAALNAIANSQSTGNTAPQGAFSQTYCVPGDSTSCAPPIAYWNLNEHTGTTAYDSSGNGYNAGFSGSPSWVSGKYSSGISTNNTTSDYLNAPNVTLGSTWTAEAWFSYPLSTTGSSWNTLFRSNVNDHQVIVQRSTNLLGMYDNATGTGFRSTGFNMTNLAAGWHHLAVTGVGGSQYFYIDSNYVGAADHQSTSDIKAIGNYQGGSQNWGVFDEVKLFNYVRTAAQIALDYNHGKPIGWWKFDECQGTTVNDSIYSSVSSTVTIGTGGAQTIAGSCLNGGTGTTAAWTNGYQGKFNSSLSLDGTDDFADLGAPNPYNTTYPLYYISSGSVSAWVKTSKSTGTQSVFSQSGDFVHTRSVNLEIQNGYPNFNTYNTDTGVSDYSCSSSTSVSDGQWHHLIWTQTGAASGLNIYVDGRKTTVTCSSGSNNGTWFTYGSGYLYYFISAVDNGNPIPAGLQDYFQGQIDDVRIYNYPLTLTQIQGLYNENSAIRFGPSSGPP